MPQDEPVIALIVAVAENGVIGCNGAMPWHHSSDLKRFRRLTMGKPMIMGRKTFEAIGKPLDGRDNIVVSGAGYDAPPQVHLASDIDGAVELARKLAVERAAAEIMIIGGAQIYRSLLPYAGRIYLTRMHCRPEGDAYFEDPPSAEWRELERESIPQGERDDCPATLIILERI